MGIVLAFAMVAAPAAQARVRHAESWAREHYAGAERMREALNGKPALDRKPRDYQRVLNAYRNIYLGAPASAKAEPSVVAVAETLVEMGRRFNDDKILHKAIDQYKFLRREYPGSKYRFDGLFTIGEIYKDDLNQPQEARATFEDFLRRYPRNRLSEGARKAIAEIDQEAKADAPEAHKPPQNQRSKNPRKNETASAEDGEESTTQTVSAKVPSGTAHLPRVTGIRHWSTPDYTRVAIDVEGDVQFSSRRVENPARILFDLPDTKLASTLVGKSFDVEDGFLKKLRVTQSASGHTSVTLEVDNLSEYDAFLLPSPYRLIVDIHGKNWQLGQHGAGIQSNSTILNGVAAKAESVATGETESSKGALEASSGGDAMPAFAGPTKTSNLLTLPSSDKNAQPKNPQPKIIRKIVEAEDDDDAASSARYHSADAKKNTMTQRRSSSTELASRIPESDIGFDGREARPTATGNRSLIRALGLKIGKIVIDPGHGGHDTGTIGPNGLEEKDLDLDVGRRLGKLLETRLGAEVIYTRKDDTFIPLETRTAIANQARADLFVSIHANSSRDAAARGVETYYLNFTSSPEALEVAARENAVSETSIYQLQDLVKKIALKEKIEESREFAWDVQQSLHSGLAAKTPAIRDRGVKKAPFIVLIGANMPSILAEISFVSNPADEHRLATSEYRQRIAESLYHGIANYVNGLSGVKVASKMDKVTGQ